MATAIIPEVWKPVVGYEGWYEASSLGRVRRMRQENNTWPKRVLVPKVDRDGYHKFTLCKYGTVKQVKCHRLVAEAFIPNPEAKPQVNHKDGNTSNNVVSNLEWATPRENGSHAYQFLGRKAVRGSDVGNSKLTEERVKNIRHLHSSYAMTRQEIATKFGVSSSLIALIVARKIWKHVA